MERVRYRKRGAAAVAFALAALAAPSAASAQAVPDASCPGPSNGFSGFVPGQSRFAQTFTAQNTGRLTQAQIGAVNKAGTAGDYIVSINAADGSGAPTNTVLASATIPDASVPPGVSTITADFAFPAEVVAEQSYAVVITRPGSNTLGIGLRNDNPCPGAFFASADQTDPFSPACGSPNPCDLVFAVFVEPPRAERTLTLDANKGKVEKKKKVRLSGQLEATGNDPACEASQSIEISRTGLKGGTPVPVTTVQTDAQGNFATKVKVKKSSLYTARTGETAGCESETSDTEKVRVQKPKAAKEA